MINFKAPLMTSNHPQMLNIKINGVSTEHALNVRPLDLCTKGDMVCSVDGKLCDMIVPLAKDCTLRFYTFNDKAGREVFWHSCAHVLGAAILEHCPDARLVSGPPTENGFYYDVEVDRPFTEKDVRDIEERAQRIIKEGKSFKRIWMEKDALLLFYAHNEFKRYFVERATSAKDSSAGQKDSANDDHPIGHSHDASNKEGCCSCYEMGTFIDFCNGPHVHNTRVIKTFEITKMGASYFLGDKDRPSLQRLYGVAFPSKAQRNEYFAFIEEAKRRNHKVIGQEYDLFWFSELSPGSAFFIEGAFIYNALMNFMRREYRKRNFTEVITPNMFMTKLWETSGHLQNYKDDMCGDCFVHHFVFPISSRATGTSLDPPTEMTDCIFSK